MSALLIGYNFTNLVNASIVTKMKRVPALGTGSGPKKSIDKRSPGPVGMIGAVIVSFARVYTLFH